MSNDIITRLIRIGELYDRMTIVINENLDTIFESHTLEEFDFLQNMCIYRWCSRRLYCF